MKKTVCLIMLLFVFLTSACTNDIKTKEITEVINDKGVRLEVDLTNKGETAQDAKNISSDIVVINNKEYRFPILVSDMIDSGWELDGSNNREDMIKPNTITSLIGFYLKDVAGNKISINSVFHKDDNPKNLIDCKINEISFSDYENDGFEIDFILPGGITPKSTAKNIVDIYGDPNDSKHFDHGSSEVDEIEYIDGLARYNYYFSFFQDGSLRSVRIKANINK